jgi:D-alanyl-D-alanine dipeptidase
MADTETPSAAIYFRLSQGATSARCGIRPWTGVNGTYVQGASQNLAASQWHRVEINAAVLPVGTTGINAVSVLISRLMSVGGTLDVTAALLEPAPVAGSFITGTAPAMAVTRSMNGVVKTHSAGAAVDLATPSFYSR